jgi:hypothetical protein
LKNISKFDKKLFPDLAKAKEEKFTIGIQRRSTRFHLLETPENAHFKVGTLVMVRNLKKS